MEVAVRAVLREQSRLRERLIGHDAVVPLRYAQRQSSRFQKDAFAVVVENCYFNTLPLFVRRLSNTHGTYCFSLLAGDIAGFGCHDSARNFLSFSAMRIAIARRYGAGCAVGVSSLMACTF
jgi:hypothetical protein